ncbi:MAG: hypothetical protein Q9205_004207 [Flavoplaca limonia]
MSSGRVESVDMSLEQDISPTNANERPISTLIWDDVVPAKVFENAPLSGQSAGNNHGPIKPRKPPSKETLPKMTFDPNKTGTQWPKRAKVSLPSVDLGRMTTVQEVCLDSPTIPGRPPLLERSMSVPAVTLHRLSEEPNQSTPRAAEFSKSHTDMQMNEASHIAAPSSKYSKRSSSLMARDLAPLIIPSNMSKNHDRDQNRSRESSGDLGTLPPRVPPKSPRTERRASPRADRSQHSTNSSVSTNYSVASSATSSSSIFGRASPRLVTDTRRVESPLGRAHPTSAVDKPSPESLWSKLFRLESPSRQKRFEMLETSNSQVSEICPTPSSTTSTHQRWLSDASAVTRGRLASKESPAYKRYSKPAVRSPSTNKRDRDLPTGFKAAEVPQQVADAEIRGLRQQADEQVSHFEVLQAKDVSLLSKELRELDDRCEYLQRTYQSLRQGRKSLHERMISYLKSPHMTKFSRESILKQEETLADIDNSIDDWIRKSEQAENRRSRVRQKLLEHVAAALTLRPNTMTGPRHVSEQHTPPESPEQEDQFPHDERQRVQSIKIYADAGVAALLAEIDQEIGSMERSAGSMTR